MIHCLKDNFYSRFFFHKLLEDYILVTNQQLVFKNRTVLTYKDRIDKQYLLFGINLDIRKLGIIE